MAKITEVGPVQKVFLLDLENMNYELIFDCPLWIL